MRDERRCGSYKPREDPDEELHHFRRLASMTFLLPDRKEERRLQWLHLRLLLLKLLIRAIARTEKRLADPRDSQRVG